MQTFFSCLSLQEFVLHVTQVSPAALGCSCANTTCAQQQPLLSLKSVSKANHNQVCRCQPLLLIRGLAMLDRFLSQYWLALPHTLRAWHLSVVLTCAPCAGTDLNKVTPHSGAAWQTSSPQRQDMLWTQKSC